MLGLRAAVLGVLLIVSLLTAPQAGAESARDGDGPHAPANRTIEATRTSLVDGVRISDFDLGNLDLTATPGQYVSPLRGQLYLPQETRGAKFVIFHHLRSEGCTQQTFAYPCPAGTQEYRWDRGMAYLGTALAKQGYAVLIPDLAPALIGLSSTGSYSQADAYVRIDNALRDRLASAVRGSTDGGFGLDLTGAIDLSQVALAGHSRSGLLIPDVAKAWAQGPTKPNALFTVGPAYDVFETQEPAFSPAPPDLPYLGIVPRMDADVRFQGNQWLAEHIGASRTVPALVASPERFGHNFFNRTASAAGLDDRKSCTPQTCATASEHEQYLASAVTSWLAQINGGGTTFPVAGTAKLPPTLAGQPTSWLAVTNGPRVSLVAGSAAEQAALAPGGASSTVCAFFQFGDDRPGTRCPETDPGVIASAGTRLRHVTWTGNASLRYAVPQQVGRLRSVALHLAPYGDSSAGKPLWLTVIDAAGKRGVVDIPGNHPALVSRASSETNGTYPISTVRLDLSQLTGVDTSAVTAIELGGATGGIALRGLDLSGDPASPSTASPQSPPPPVQPPPTVVGGTGAAAAAAADTPASPLQSTAASVNRPRGLARTGAPLLALAGLALWLLGAGSLLVLTRRRH